MGRGQAGPTAFLDTVTSGSSSHLSLLGPWSVHSPSLEPIDSPNTPVRPLTLSQVLRLCSGSGSWIITGSLSIAPPAPPPTPCWSLRPGDAVRWGHNAECGAGAPSHHLHSCLCSLGTGLEASGVGSAPLGWEVRAGASSCIPVPAGYQWAPEGAAPEALPPAKRPPGLRV